MSDINQIQIPKWGLAMEEGTVNRWLISEGDSFTKGDELCEIESSKIVNVLEAPFDGVLRRILAGSGDTLPVQAPIAVSADMSVSDAEVDAYIVSLAGSSEPVALVESASAEPPVARKSPADVAQVSATAVPEHLKSGNDDSEVFATAKARKHAATLGVNLNNITGSGRGGRISIKDIDDAIGAAGDTVEKQTSETGSVKPSSADDSDVAATSVARRLAAKLGINLHDVATGSRGRISKEDVEAAHRKAGGGNSVPAMATAVTASVTPVPQGVEEVPMSGMRKMVGARLQESKQKAPHFRQIVDCEVDNLLALREIINNSPKVKLSVNDFVIKACAMALRENPDVNVQYDEASQIIRRFEDADISVAVAIPDGLITPIVKQANRKSISEISADIRNLATKAKAGTLKPDEFQGGTFTISNLGMYGIKQFDSIINPPQCAILSVGAAEPRIIVKAGEPVVATVMTIAIAADHRVIDGAVAAVFVQSLKKYIENPALMVA